MLLQLAPTENPDCKLYLFLNETDDSQSWFWKGDYNSSNSNIKKFETKGEGMQWKWYNKEATIAKRQKMIKVMLKDRKWLK